MNLSLGQLCVAAGVPQSNLSRWKQGGSPSIRTLSRDLSKLQDTLGGVEFSMAMKLIDRINPAAAPRIAELLQTPGGWGYPAELRAVERRGPGHAA